MEKLLPLKILILVMPYVLTMQPKIIIIGAGASGIAAATYLLENNLTNITILEAEPKIGGRINTVKFGGSFVDVGAQWCHGEKGNIVYEKVKDLDLLGHYDHKEKLFFSSNKNVSKEFLEKLLNIMNELDEDYCSDVASDYNNLGDTCTNSYNYSVYKTFENNEEQLLALEALDYYHHRSLGYEGAFSWFDVSIDSDFVTCEGDPDLHWKKRGYEVFLDVLTKKYPDSSHQFFLEEKVLLNKEVNKIFWNETSDSHVKVVCSDESVYFADHLIFTPSIGVLKEQHQTLFEPALPPKKQEAISNIGFGAVITIWMYFSNHWWKDNIDYGLVWTQQDMKKTKLEFPEGPTLNGRSWVTYISEIQSEKYKPNLMLAWVTGEIVPSFELIPEDVIKEGLFFILKKFLGDYYNVSKPDKILRSTWYGNPHFKGTYSYQTLKTKKREGGSSSEDDLAEPLRNSEGRPVVQFAGEATHPTYYSTVHGAVESGYREAKTLVSLYKQ